MKRVDDSLVQSQKSEQYHADVPSKGYDCMLVLAAAGAQEMRSLEDRK